MTQRFYATAGRLEVMTGHDFSREHLFKKFRNIDTETLKTFFHESDYMIYIYKTLDDAKNHAAQLSRPSHGLSEEFYPNKHLYYTTPIYEIEVDDKINPRWITEDSPIGTASRHENLILRMFGLPTNHHNIKFERAECELIDVISVNAVHVYHPKINIKYAEFHALDANANSAHNSRCTIL